MLPTSAGVEPATSWSICSNVPKTLALPTILSRQVESKYVAQDKVLFSMKNGQYFSYFSVKAYAVGTH